MKILRGHLLRGFCLTTLTIGSIVAATGNLKAQDHGSVEGVYRLLFETRDDLAVWIVDGKRVREDIFPEFLYGGNDQRYPFVPKREIWIDHAIAAEEYAYTVEHELYERMLMESRELTYDAAHDSALMLEHRLRLRDQRTARDHEKNLPRVSPTDSYGEQELTELPDSISLRDIYRVFVGKREHVDIWIVDGAVVRRDIYPDFGLSGNDLAYHFIPANEIWIDGDISCEETGYSIAVELRERQSMNAGMDYDDAYEQAIKQTHADRMKDQRNAALHPSVIVTLPLTRDRGVKEDR